MATLEELVQVNAELSGKVNQFPEVVNNLEAAITAALASVGLTAAQQAMIDEAFATAQTALGSAQAAIDDAGDGVDEGQNPQPA